MYVRLQKREERAGGFFGFVEDLKRGRGLDRAEPEFSATVISGRIRMDVDNHHVSTKEFLRDF